MALIPLHDRNPRVNIKYHYVTVGLIAGNLVVFLYQLGLPEALLHQVILGLGMVPGLLFGTETLPAHFPQVSPVMTLITYQFLHGGWGHLVFNMLYLWVFGDNVEDAMGHWRFLVFYLVCGVIAALTHAAVDMANLSPVVGASGSISGVLGAYIILHPKVRVLTLVFGFIPLRLPALLVLGVFFAQNLLFAVTGGGSAGNVAIWAHIGGFLAGMALIAGFRYSHVKLWHKPPRPWG
ncbi:MAG: rhomboid family intramembrane serine protease [Alphaproteobacteria bacterium]|nr:rhomboid family intramembrane serine protease [Alphaproteobacteria bacterium]